MRIAFDTQVISYFLQANQHGYDPATDSDDHAKQKVAAFCLWMYVGNPVVVPTVFAECNNMRNDERKRREHFNWNAYYFCEVLPESLDAKRVSARTAELSAHHPGARNLNDCRIVAECEEPGATVNVLAVFDTKLVKHLSGKSRILVASPFECLMKANIAEDTRARVILKAEHPLYAATWWRLSNVLGK